MKRVLTWSLTAIMLATSAWAMVNITVAKNETAVGGTVYRLDPGRAAAFKGWEHVVAHLREIGETELLAQLEERRAQEQVWIAPRMPPGIRAAWVATLGLVKRIYVAERELVSTPEALYPQLDVPPAHRETFAWMSLAGTLVHELAHARGVEAETGAYAIELQWLHTLRNLPRLQALPPEQRRAYDWAIETAIGNAERARVRATGS